MRTRRYVRLGWCAGIAAVAALGGTSRSVAQTSATASVEPEGARVGEAFSIHVVVSRGAPGETRFPALIELPDALEQRGAVQIASSDGDRSWRAEYPVVAWRADTVSVPPIEVGLDADGARAVAVEVPAFAIASVLPADSAELALRDPKPFLRASGFPWWVLLLGLSAAAIAWWLRRGRPEPMPAPVPLGPGGRALREFERLRSSWLTGDVSAARFYDDYEATLRAYARSTRGWSASRSLSALGDNDVSLLRALTRSVLARFARVRPGADGPIASLDAGERFVRSELPPEPDADDEVADS
ncbi:MAG: hypothetical protein MJB57_16505 [Gemmatimonadetes bacterium]|nr:hypothetical protein [Gemmatimonadota bacterium]